jgi:hypothetical protein
MRDLPQKPKEAIKSLADVKVLFPELASEIDLVLSLSPSFGEKMILGLIHEVIGQINNRKGALKLNPNGIDLPSSIEMIQQFGAVRIPIDLIPAESDVREEFLKEQGGKSQTHTTAMLVTILTGKFKLNHEDAQESAYEPHKDLATTKAMSDLCNKLTDLTEKEMLGYTISRELRVEFLQAEKFAKDKVKWNGSNRTASIDEASEDDRKELFEKYRRVFGKIIDQIESDKSIQDDLKKKLRENIKNELVNVVDKMGGIPDDIGNNKSIKDPSRREYLFNITKFGDIKTIIHELIKQVKNDGKEVPVDKDYIDRFNRICDVFGAKLQENKNRPSLVLAMQQIIPKMGIKNIADLMAGSNKNLIERIIEEPVTTIAADGIVGKKSANYAQEMKDVRDILVASLKSPVKDKAVGEEAVPKKRRASSVIEMENRFKEILSNGKGGVDPEAVKFFQIPGNAKKWVEALEQNPDAFKRMGDAGKRFNSPEAQQWVQNLIDHPLEYKSFFTNLNVKGELTSQTLKDGNEMLEGFCRMVKHDVSLIVVQVAMQAFSNNAEEANKHVDKIISNNLGNFAEGYRLLCTTESLKEVTKPENSKLVAEFISRSGRSHQHVESIYNKLHTTKIQKADFKDMLAIHGALFEKFENVVKLGNINAVMDAVFKFAEVKGMFYGSAIKKDSMNAVINSKGFDKFIAVMNKDPELGKVILEEVSKIKGLNPVQRLEAFNAIHDGMHVSTKVKDDERIRADIKKVIAASTTGFFSKQVHVDKLEENMKAVKADLAVYSKDVLSERGKRYYNEGEKTVAKVEEGNDHSKLDSHVKAIQEQGLRFDLINKHGSKIAKPKNLESLRKSADKVSGRSDGGRGMGA